MAIMRRCVILTLVITSVLFFSACGNSTEPAVKTFYDSITLSDYVSLGTYKGIELDYTPAATDEEVDEAVQKTLRNNAVLEKITDRAVEGDDVVHMFFTGYVDGEKNDDCSLAEEDAEDFDLATIRFIDGFKDAIVGKMPGETFKTEGLSFPEDYGAAELNGKPVEFEIHVEYIAKYTVPELSDETASNLSEGEFTTVDAFVANVKAELEQSKTDDLVKNADDYKWQKVLDDSTVTQFPESEMEYYRNDFNSYYESYAEQYGVTLEDFIAQYMNMTTEQFTAEANSNAEVSVKNNLVVAAIAQAENIVISQPEFQTELESLAEEYSYDSLDELKSMYTDEFLYSFLLQRKVIDFVVEHSVDTNMPATEAASE